MNSRCPENDTTKNQRKRRRISNLSALKLNEEGFIITLLERYSYLKSLVTERKEEFEKLCEFAETETEYLTAPASSRFHLCNEGGLLEHSLNVAEIMLKMKNTLCPDISDESCVVTALFHDLGKVGMPDNPMYVKNIGKNGKEPSICLPIHCLPKKHPYYTICTGSYLRGKVIEPIGL